MRRGSWKTWILLALLTMLLGWTLPIATAQEGNDAEQLQRTERALKSLYEQISPSVVSIRVDQLLNGEYHEWTGGSGFVLDHDGHIVTNYHVVSDSDRVIVSFLDGTIVLAEIVGLDPFSDVAVIKVDLEAERLFPLEFADSDKVQVGQMAIAMGSPFGQDWTLTTGIVSALNRQITSLSDFDIGAVIQTDTAINPGNSGGPLLNLDGEVIGVNTQIISERRVNSGVGFAIPSNLVRRAANDLIAFGEVGYGFLGIEGENMSLDFMTALDLPNDTQGVVVIRVDPGSPADRAGLQSPVSNSRSQAYESADIITAINDVTIHSVADLLDYIATYTHPGDVVTMTVIRDDDSIQIELILGAR